MTFTHEKQCCNGTIRVQFCPILEAMQDSQGKQAKVDVCGGWDFGEMKSIRRAGAVAQRVKSPTEALASHMGSGF